MKHSVENAFMKRCLLLSLLFLSHSYLLTAQIRALLEWEISPSYNRVVQITGNQQIIFGASDNGLFSFRQNQPVNTLDKSVGLSDVGVGAMVYIEESEHLLIGYHSGIIDQISSKEILTDQSILNLDSRISKTIHSVAYAYDQAFFASDLGIISYRIDQKQAQDIYRNIGDDAASVSCFEVLLDQDTVYAFCNLGLFKGSIKQNLLDYTQWKKLTDFAFSERTRAVLHNQRILFSYGDENLIKMSTSGDLIDTINCLQKINDLTVANGSVMIAAGNTIRQLSQDNNLLFYTIDNEILSLHFDSKVIWIGQQDRGITSLDGTMDIFPSGPQSDQPSKIKSIDEKMYFFDQSPIYTTYNGSKWEVNTSHGKTLDAVSFLNDQWILHISGQLISKNDIINLPVDASSQANGTFIFDEKIWITSSDSQTPIISSPDLKNWTSYSSSLLGTSSLSGMQVSQGGTFYFIDHRDRLIAFEPLEEKIRRIDQADGLPTSSINDYTIDENDILYIATDQGLYFYPDATFIFNNDNLIEAYVDGGALLQEDQFNALTVDAGNRKWLATDDGLWLYSSNLTKEIKHFTRENSSLPSNDIHKLVYHSYTGLLWTLTSNGIASLQTDSKESQFTHHNVKIYPNPISLRFGTTNVGLKGVYHNASIKITTISGSYINEIEANGSLASWDLTDTRGRRVGPGIYLFFSSNEDGNDTYIGKILVEP
jgi:ligand-binding sensor domain-containing protein